MARSTSEEEVQLKKRARRRLVGAVVLATGVAVVLPMVLDTEPKPVSQNVNIQIPSPDSPAYAPKAGAPADAAKDTAAAASEPAKPAPSYTETKPALPPVAGLQASETPKAAEPAKQAEPPKAPPSADKVAEAPKEAEKAPAKEAAKPAARDTTKNAKEGGKPVAKETAKPAAKAASSKDNAKAAGNGKFVVQIAALADTAKAKQLHQKVAGAGVKAYTEVVHTAKGSVTRVRAGPYDTREAAEKARGRLKGAGLDGKVVPR